MFPVSSVKDVPGLYRGSYSHPISWGDQITSHSHLNFLDDKNVSFQGWDSYGNPIGAPCPTVKLTYQVDSSNNINFFLGNNVVMKGTVNGSTININYYGGSGTIYPDVLCSSIGNGSDSLVSGNYS